MKTAFSLILFISFGNFNAQIVNIPDTNFKNILIHDWGYNNTFYGYGYDTNHDGEIQYSEAENILSLDIKQRNIQDLKGIEACINLKSLNCAFNNLSSIYLTNSNLEDLDCHAQGNGNLLNNLDITLCINLKTLVCGSNPINNLNLLTLTSLTYIDCSYNLITSLDLTGLILLDQLNADNSFVMQSLNLTECKNLSSITFPHSSLTNIIFKNNNNLSYIQLNNNPMLETLDVTLVPNLTHLDCSKNGLKTLKINNLNYLQAISCNENKIQELDLTGLTNLIALDCNNNQLTKLNLSNLYNLQWVDCSFNILNEVETINNNSIGYLNCSNNQLKKIKINNLSSTGPFSLDCSHNLTETLAFDRITDLICDYNHLTSLDLSNKKDLTHISCSNNFLKYLNLKSTASLPFYSQIDINFENNQNLSFVCADDFQIDNLKSYFYNINRTDIQVSDKCEFKPFIYPNPANTSTKITSAVYIKTLQIISSRGQIVKIFNDVNDYELDINVSDLQTGVYFIQIIGQYKDKYVTKLIKI